MHPIARRLRAAGRERGASLVEFAFVMPLIMLLLFGLIEFGLAFRDRLTIAHAAQSAARIGSVLGTAPESDYAILQAVDAGLRGSSVDPGAVTAVIIYRAAPSGAMTADQNHYAYDPTDPACPWNPCPNPGPDFEGYGVPSNWGDPGVRVTALPSPDVLGVQIRYDHQWVTRILPWMNTPASWSDDARVRLEPDVFGSGGP